jgi:hypothetical protein
MKVFTAFYNMKSSNFFRSDKDIIPTVSEMMNDSAYVEVGEFKAKDLEDAYEILNIAHPEEVVNFVREMARKDPGHELFPKLHTSMSVGDILLDNESSKYYFCDNCGWLELKN